MKINLKTMGEYILVIISGLMAVGISVSAIYKGNKQEEETKKYQEETKQLQKEVKKKTEEIIDLNKQLKSQADSHALELKKLTIPVPPKIGANFFSTIKFEEEERIAIQNYFEANNAVSNIITRAFPQQIGMQIPTLNKIFSASIRIFLDIYGENDREIKTVFGQQPLTISENPLDCHNSFSLSYNRDSNEVEMRGWFLISKSCHSNSHTLYDFEHFRMGATVQFSAPGIYFGRTSYAIQNADYIQVILRQVDLSFENIRKFNISLKEIQMVKDNEFESGGKLLLT
jgi:hypothetical protein